jgi:ATP-dependent Clp protease ATP-binding subunit ClpC
MSMTYRRPVNFTERARRVMELASTFAAECRHPVVSPVHIAIGLMREGEGVAATALRFHGLKLDSLERVLTDELSNVPTLSQPESQFSAESQALLDEAGDESRSIGHPYVGTEHLLLALVRDSGAVSRLLSGHGMTYEMTKARVLYILNADLENPEPFVSPTAV